MTHQQLLADAHDDTGMKHIEVIVRRYKED
jgi:hypothetical protein